MIFYYRRFFSKRSCRFCLPAGTQCSCVFPSSPLSCSELFGNPNANGSVSPHRSCVGSTKHPCVPPSGNVSVDWLVSSEVSEGNERGCVKYSQLFVKSYLAILLKSYPVLILPRFLVRAHTRSSPANTSLARSAGRSRDGWWREWKMRCYGGNVVHIISMKLHRCVGLSTEIPGTWKSHNENDILRLCP